MLTALSLGLLLGLRHAFDPDHLVAVSALCTRHRSAGLAASLGLCWGLGHATTLIVVGLAVIALRVAIPDSLALGFELGVGVLLMGLGVANLWAARRSRTTALPATLPTGAALARSGVLGLAHGLAGSAALVLLATAAMPTPTAAVAFLLVFGVAITLGMAGFSLLLGAPLARLGDRAPLRRYAVAASGALSLAFGCWLVYTTGSALAPAV